NTLFIILAYIFGYGITNLLDGIAGNPMFILYILFSPIGRAIWGNFDGIIYALDTASVGFLLLNIAYIIAPLVAAIITGRLSDNRMTSLIAFIVSAIISMLVCIILVLQGVQFRVVIGQDLNQDTAILNVVLGSIVNGCLYGLIALALTKNK
ncbi:MAG: hypothetical protein ACTSP9_19000, partial [Promethearchaeota archaeon]